MIRIPDYIAQHVEVEVGKHWLLLISPIDDLNFAFFTFLTVVDFFMFTFESFGNFFRELDIGYRELDIGYGTETFSYLFWFYPIK